MKKLTTRSFAALASLGLVAGALTAAPAQANTVTIKVVTPNYTDDMPAYYKDLNARFMAANPTIKVEHENLSWDDILVKGRTYISTKSYPDVLNLNTFSEFAAEGLLYIPATCSLRLNFLTSLPLSAITQSTTVLSMLFQI